jgi:hypothetical protein
MQPQGHFFSGSGAKASFSKKKSFSKNNPYGKSISNFLSDFCSQRLFSRDFLSKFRKLPELGIFGLAT